MESVGDRESMNSSESSHDSESTNTEESAPATESTHDTEFIPDTESMQDADPMNVSNVTLNNTGEWREIDEELEAIEAMIDSNITVRPSEELSGIDEEQEALFITDFSETDQELNARNMGYITVNTLDWREIDEQLRSVIMRTFGEVDAESEAIITRTVAYMLAEVDADDDQGNNVHGVDINNIPSVVYRSNLVEGETRCVVCLEYFIERETVKRTEECGHMFHVLCIQTWLHNKCTCPLCRSWLCDHSHVHQQ